MLFTFIRKHSYLIVFICIYSYSIRIYVILRRTFSILLSEQVLPDVCSPVLQSKKLFNSMSVDLSCEEKFFLSACVFFHIAFVISYVCLSKFYLPSFVFVRIYSYFVYISIMKKKFCSHRIHSYFVRNFVRFFVRNLIHIHPYTFVFVHIHSYICHPKSYIKHICNLVMSSFRLQ